MYMWDQKGEVITVEKIEIMFQKQNMLLNIMERKYEIIHTVLILRQRGLC